MSRNKGGTAIHQSEHRIQIEELMEHKGDKSFGELRDEIEEKFGVDVSTRQVRYYYNNYLRPQIEQKPKEVEEAIEERTEMIDVLEEKMELYQEQLERIEIDRKLEEGTNKLMSGLSGEISLALNLLQSIERTKQNLGLMKRELGKLEVDLDQNKEEKLEVSDLDEEHIQKISDALMSQYEEED